MLSRVNTARKFNDSMLRHLSQCFQNALKVEPCKEMKEINKLDSHLYFETVRYNRFNNSKIVLSDAKRMIEVFAAKLQEQTSVVANTYRGSDTTSI